MNICYLANSASVHTQRWARHFTRRGHQVTVVSFHAGKIEGIPVYQFPPTSGRRRLSILLNVGRVRHLVWKINPDILHAHYVTGYGLAAALTGWHPLIMTAWGSDVLIAPEQSWIYRQIVRFALGRADLVTSMAEHMTRHLIERRYASADKIVTLPFGVDTDVFSPDQRTRQHGDGPPLVVSTRRLQHGLDVDVFIRAIPTVLACCPDARFVVTGGGPLRGQLEQLATDLGVAERIEFRGEITHQEMPKLLGQADVFVSTSPSDGNNVSLNEAMACGAFPIATDIPANRAWLEPGQNGLLFPCQDSSELAQKIIEALRQPGWRQAAIPRNWEIIRTRASWAREMARMEDLYVALVH